jgi:hypothetical protein
MDTLQIWKMFNLMGNLEKDVLCFLFQDAFHFRGSTVPKPAGGGWLAQPLPVPEPAPISLEQKSSESGPGVGCGRLSKLRNVLVITFYCCLHLNFQTYSSQPVFLHPVSYLIPTANLTLAPFLQKHLTLCRNLTSTSLLPLPQKGSAGLG